MQRQNKKRPRNFRLQIVLFSIIAILCLLLFRFYYIPTPEDIAEVIIGSMDPKWLGAPGAPPTDFDVWGEFERKLTRSAPVRQIVVTKFDKSGVERMVHPYYHLVFFPRYFERQARVALTFPISQSGKEVGFLYVHLDDVHLRSLHLFFWAILTLIILGSVSAYMKFGFQERSYEDVSSQLEEKKRQLTHLEKLALVGQLTANVLHDLRKPILNIRDELEMMPEGEQKRVLREQVDLFLEILREVNIEGFLTGESAKDEFLDLDDVIQQSLRLVKYEAGNVEVNVNVDDDTPFILATKHRVVQVFSNLFLNAFEAMKGHGELHVAAGRIEEDGALFAEATVRDTGKGIPQMVVSRIFDPFFSEGKTDQSTGLGLYITRTIVEELDGEIFVESAEGVGTTFRIRIPAPLTQNLDEADSTA